MFNTNPWLSSASPSNYFSRSYIQGFLDICGNIVLRNGGFSLTNGDVSMNGNLRVGKNTTTIGDISMNGSLFVGLDASFNRNVSIKGTTTTTTKSIYQIDGNTNMNIASSAGTFPNYKTTAIGPNLINIGSSNFDLVSNGLRHSIAIGSDIMEASNPIGHSNIGIGKRVFPLLQRGTQNIGIGNNVATSLIAGDNNIFIGVDVAKNVVSGGNIVAIGTNAGTNAGENCTFYGGYTGSLSTSYRNSTAIGYGTTVSQSNQIKFPYGSVYAQGGSRVDGPVSCNYLNAKKIFADSFKYTGIVQVAANKVILSKLNPEAPSGLTIYDNVNSFMDSGYFKAPVAGYYLFFVNIAMYQQQTTKWSLNVYGSDLSANLSTASEFYVNWVGGNAAGKHNPTVSALRLLNAGDSVKVVTTTIVTLTYDEGQSTLRSCMNAMLLAAV
jgi:hypothetical protein